MKRIYELDALRGLGILLVVFFHTAWDICSEYNLEIINAPLITALVYLFAGMLIWGASSYLGKYTLKRGVVVLLCALGVTAVTYVLFPKNYIGFGILHLLGVSMLLSWVIKKCHALNWTVLILAVAAFAFGLFVGKIHVETNLLFEDYSFIAKSSDNSDRFILKLSRGTTDLEEEHFAYINNNGLIINNASGNATLQIFDVMGRPVSSHNVSGNANIAMESLTNGVYILRLIDDNNVRIQKVVID